MQQTLAVLSRALDDLGLTYETERKPSGTTTVVVELPGEHKLRTTCAFVLGQHSLAANAFVMRAPQEREAEVHRWLLRRNQRLFGIAYAIDRFGDLYLVGRGPHGAVTPEVVDQILGAVASTADGYFDVLLEMGFESAIRAEWRWRLERGEPTRNLDAFRHLAPEGPDAAGFGLDR